MSNDLATQGDLLRVMAERFGIPAAEIHKPKVMALLANAIQRQRQYGWQPGVHMSVQKFTSKEEGEVYTLVDGEKAWKDSFIRWRTEYGVRWKFQRRIMTPEEVEAEAKLMGFFEKLPQHAYGVWSRIVIEGEDDPNDPDNPMWASGIWFGKIRAGKFWKDDYIPVGTSSRDVAVRRADKRAMMQSSLGLIPLDNRSADERAQDLEAVARIAQANQPPEPARRPQLPAPPVQDEQADYVEDGEIIDEPAEQLDLGHIEPADLEINLYAAAFQSPEYKFSQAATQYITRLRELDKASERPMAAEGYKATVTALNEAARMEVGHLVLNIVLGRTVDARERPGVNTKDIYTAAKDKANPSHAILMEIANIALQVAQGGDE